METMESFLQKMQVEKTANIDQRDGVNIKLNHWNEEEVGDHAKTNRMKMVDKTHEGKFSKEAYQTIRNRFNHIEQGPSHQPTDTVHALADVFANTHLSDDVPKVEESEIPVQGKTTTIKRKTVKRRPTDLAVPLHISDDVPGVKDNEAPVPVVKDNEVPVPAVKDNEVPVPVTTTTIKRKTVKRRPTNTDQETDPNLLFSDVPIEPVSFTDKTGTATMQTKPSPYYLANRKLYLEKMSKLFVPYKTAMATNDNSSVSCQQNSDDEEFKTLSHQQIVVEYLNVYTPYRGLLLYHNLGSGKSCSAIAIAEGFKHHGRKIIVMTPASLDTNFNFELKKCGDPVYRKNQHWTFHPATSGSPSAFEKLSLDAKFVETNHGAWIPSPGKQSNFSSLSDKDQTQIDRQINHMIANKYQTYHYNGNSTSAYNTFTQHDKVNPFDHAVVIIDEAHNLVSRIVNKLPKTSSSNFFLKIPKASNCMSISCVLPMFASFYYLVHLSLITLMKLVCCSIYCAVLLKRGKLQLTMQIMLVLNWTGTYLWKCLPKNMVQKRARV